MRANEVKTNTVYLFQYERHQHQAYPCVAIKHLGGSKFLIITLHDGQRTEATAGQLADTPGSPYSQPVPLVVTAADRRRQQQREAEFQASLKPRA